MPYLPYLGVVRGVNVSTTGSPMECLAMDDSFEHGTHLSPAAGATRHFSEHGTAPRWVLGPAPSWSPRKTGQRFAGEQEMRMGCEMLFLHGWDVDVDVDSEVSKQPHPSPNC